MSLREAHALSKRPECRPPPPVSVINDDDGRSSLPAVTGPPGLRELPSAEDNINGFVPLRARNVASYFASN